MIRFKNIFVSRGGRPLIQNASLDLYIGERVALLGANGTGKTTLLNTLLGEVPLDRGEIEQPFRKLVSLSQHLPQSDLPSWQHVVESDEVLIRAREKVDEVHRTDADGMLIAEAHQDLLDAGESTANSRAQTLLAGLGFTDERMNSAVNTLSGGWRMRLNLARALFVESELLLLDEPTNHLDLDAIVWFERWLIRYQGTAIIVSHDRDFVDRVATHSLFLENQVLKKFPGGYSDAERQRAEQQMLAQKSAEQTQRKAEHLEKFITRFRAKASKAKQAQSRIKALEKLKVEMPLRLASGLDFEFQEATGLADPMLKVEDLALGYAGQPLLSKVTWTIREGARTGLLGQNGAGKSSLIKMLFDAQNPQSPEALQGEIVPSKNIRVGYFAQQALENLRDDDTPVTMLKREFPEKREQELRAILGRFGFSGENSIRPIGPMSGGEKARVVLCSIVLQRPNFLVLDEPTNHLDAQAREALTDALASFDGALVLVSHDRYMLRAVVDEFMLVRGASLKPFDGDLDDYAKLSLEQAAGGKSAQKVEAQKAISQKPSSIVLPQETPKQLMERKAKTAPLDKRLKRIEGELEKTLQSITETEKQLADQTNYGAGKDMADLQMRYAYLAKTRDELELEWLEITEQKEAIL